MQKRKNNIRIAIDCMGGDNAPHMAIEALHLALKKSAGLHFVLYGQKNTIESLLSNYQHIKKDVTIVNTDVIILPDDKPSTALRKKNSSMHMTLKSVANGEANCAISAGNTGALMAISRSILGMLPNIDRPAIVTALPTLKDEMVMLDLGANVECNAQMLYQFALMGRAFSQAVFYKKKPSVALLNIGSEEVKGTEQIKQAYTLIQDSKHKINFQGYIEADQMFNGDCDVIVTDGFCGNIALKNTEGIFQFLKQTIKNSYSHSILGKVYLILLRLLLKKPLQNFDPKLRNGAMLIGLNGVVIKSHGNASSESFENAIHVAANAIRNNINEKIEIK